MSFTRVRSVEGAAHEYDVPTAFAIRHPEMYVVVDPTPSPVSRPKKFVVESVPTTPKAARPKRASTTAKARTKRAPSQKKENRHGS